jgi:hypothetical protein
MSLSSGVGPQCSGRQAAAREEKRLFLVFGSRARHRTVAGGYRLMQSLPLSLTPGEGRGTCRVGGGFWAGALSHMLGTRAVNAVPSFGRVRMLISISTVL